MVPQGMDLVMGRATLNSDGSSTVTLWDARSRSWMLVDADTGADRGRRVAGTSSAQASGQGASDGADGGGETVRTESDSGDESTRRDTATLFDQILTSIARVPLR